MRYLMGVKLDSSHATTKFPCVSLVRLSRVIEEAANNKEVFSPRKLGNKGALGPMKFAAFAINSHPSWFEFSDLHLYSL